MEPNMANICFTVIYLSLVPPLQTIYSVHWQIDPCIVNGGNDTKDRVHGPCDVVKAFAGRTEKSHENLSKDRRSPE
jgi:hypothetical protein